MFIEDLDQYLNDFGQRLYISFQAGGVKEFQAIFDNAYFNPELGEMDLKISQPRLTCKESDTLRMQKGDMIKINSKVHYVLKILPDGTGMAVITLSLNK